MEDVIVTEEPGRKTLKGNELQTRADYDRDWLLNNTSGSQAKENAEEDSISFVEEVDEDITIIDVPSYELGERVTESPMAGED